MTLSNRVETIVGVYPYGAILEEYLEKAARLVISDIPEHLLMSIAAEETDSGSGVDIENKRLLRAHKDGYSARPLDAYMRSRFQTTQKAGNPGFYVLQNTAFVLPGGGTVITVSFPDINRNDKSVTGWPTMLTDLVVERAAQLIIDQMMTDERDGYSTVVTLPTAPTAPAAPAYTYSNATATSPIATSVSALPTAPVYTAPTLDAKPTVPTVGSLDLTKKADGVTTLSPPTAPSAPLFTYSDAAAATVGSITVSALPPLPTYNSPSYAGNLAIPALPALDLTTQIDGVTAIQTINAPGAVSLSWTNIAAAASASASSASASAGIVDDGIAPTATKPTAAAATATATTASSSTAVKGSSTAASISETGLSPSGSSVTAADLTQAFLDAIAVAPGTIDGSSETVTPGAFSEPYHTVAGDIRPGWEGPESSDPTPVANGPSMVGILNTAGTDWNASVVSAFKVDKLSTSNMLEMTRLVYNTATSDIRLAIVNDAASEVIVAFPELADIPASLPDVSDIFTAQVADDPVDVNGTKAATDIAYGFDPDFTNLNAEIGKDDSEMAAVEIERLRLVLQERAQYVQERQIQFQADLEEWRIIAKETLSRDLGKQWEAVKISLETAVSRYEAEIAAILRYQQANTEWMFRIFEVDGKIRLDTFRAYLENAGNKHSALLAYYNVRVNAALQDARFVTEANIAGKRNMAANDQLVAQITTQANEAKETLFVNATKSNKEFVQRANEATARLSTQASIAAAQNLAQSRSTAARLSTDSSIANAQMETQVALENSKTALEAALSNLKAATDTALNNSQVSTQVAVQNAQMDLSTALANLQSATQVVLANAQAGTQVSLQNAKMAVDVAVSNAQSLTQVAVANAQIADSVSQLNAVNTYRKSVEEYQNKLARVQSNIETAQYQVGIQIQTFDKAFQKAIEPWREAQRGYLQKYGVDVQSAGDEFNGAMQDHSREADRIFEQARIDAQKVAQQAQLTTDVALQNELQTIAADMREYTESLQRFSLESQLYNIEVNTVVQQFVNLIDRNLRLFEIDSATGVQRFRALVDDARITFEGNLAVHAAGVRRNEIQAQITAQEAAQVAKQATDISQVNEAQAIQAAASLYQSKLSLFSQEADLYTAQSQAALGKQKTVTEAVRAKLSMMNYDRTRCIERYQRMFGSFIRSNWRQRAIIVKQHVI